MDEAIRARLKGSSDLPAEDCLHRGVRTRDMYGSYCGACGKQVGWSGISFIPEGVKVREKVYVSGPISGRPNHNREAFEEACQRLRDNGYHPINPLDDCEPRHAGGCRGKRKSETGEHSYGCYLLYDLAYLAECDHIMFLDGWEDSLGARAEHAFALALGIPVMEIQ